MCRLTVVMQKSGRFVFLAVFGSTSQDFVFILDPESLTQLNHQFRNNDAVIAQYQQIDAGEEATLVYAPGRVC